MTHVVEFGFIVLFCSNYKNLLMCLGRNHEEVIYQELKIMTLLYHQT
jgi:hypothetical protein